MYVFNDTGKMQLHGSVPDLFAFNNALICFKQVLILAYFSLFSKCIKHLLSK